MASFTMDGTTIFSKSGSDVTYSTGTLQNITYSTGTLSSNVTFPAGHVLQQVRIVDSTYSADNTTSWNTVFTGIQITNVTSGSKVMIQACIAHLIEGGGQGAFRIIRASDSTVLGHSQHSSGGNGSWRAIMPTIIVEDTSPSAGTNNYTLQKRSSSPTIYYNYHQSTHEGTRSFYLLTEMTQ